MIEPHRLDGSPGNNCNFSHRRKGSGRASRAARNRLRRMFEALSAASEDLDATIYADCFFNINRF